MENTETLVKKLQKIADAIREKTGKTDPLLLSEFDDEILSIKSDTRDIYDGPTEVTPSFSTTILETAGTAIDDDITVKPIDVTIVSNPAGGNTLII